ncbi:MAG: hypothetical protein H6851_07650 [Geminicoccaceae bacterium]|nr:hypothetical protein [Geminicoccaceae bacterium]MCB9943479.1 hypothetical protein [Geminicoccaceae bacterium]
MEKVDLNFIARQLERVLTEQAAMRTEQAIFREDMASMRNEQASLRTEMASMREQIARLDSKLDLTRQSIELRIDAVRLELIEEISTISRMEASGVRIPVDHRLDDHEARIAALEGKAEPAG